MSRRGPAAAAASSRGPLWRAGHRPFFLAAAVSATALVPLWLLLHAGVLPAPRALPPAVWHGHEMLFGYVLAVLSGFLLLADAGWHIVTLLALWAAARLALALPMAVPESVGAALQLAYLPALALLRRPPFWRRAKWPTIGFPLLFLGLLAAQLLIHAEALGLAAGRPGLGLRLASDLFTLMVVVVGGRLVAGYTRAAGLPVRRPRQPWLERLSVIGMLALIGSELAGFTPATGLAALAVALLQAVRLAGWRSHETLRQPLLWVLHLGFAWVVVGLALRGMAELTGSFAVTDALHAVTVGGFGSLTLGMMGRLARSHARVPLTVGRAGAAAFLAVSLAALVRLAVPALPAAWAEPGLGLAGGLWTAAFVLFLIDHAALLVRGEARPPRASARGVPLRR